MKQSKRIFYYDVLRAIAIIGIVFCHASISFVSKPNMMNLNYFIISSVFDCFRDFSIPIFVMLSGALLIGKKDTLTDFFKRRLSRLFIPFIFWVVIYAIYSFIFIRHSIDLNYALDIFLGAPGTLGVAFWFVWMIVLSYVGIFIINKAIQWGNSKHDGFDKKFFDLTDAEEDYMTFSTFSMAGEENFPGNISLSVKYTFKNNLLFLFIKH